MAHTAHKTEDEILEIRDDPAVIERKVEKLARIIQGSKRFVVWTGAGVSTSSGVPDFRGPQGKWTLAAQGKERDPTLKVVSTLSAHPSLAHMSLVELLNKRRLRHLISTNTDGLHRRSGVPGAMISELHGNGNKGRCDKCHKWVFIDERVRNPRATVHDHATDQKCLEPGCDGTICDTIINFGEYLHEEITATANGNGDVADVLLVLGSSLRVITCDALEKIQENRGKLIIVNLQKTPYDDACAVRIFADCDTVMHLLMTKLGLEIPPWVLHRFCTISQTPTGVVVRGTDETKAMPYTFAKKVTVYAEDGTTVLGVGAPRREQRYAPIDVPLNEGVVLADGCRYFVELECVGHNGEPPCRVPMVASSAAPPRSLRLSLNIDGDKLWQVADF